MNKLDFREGIELQVPDRASFGFRVEDKSIVVVSTGSGETPRNGIVAVIPAYNEERFIGSVALKARQQAGTVIIVDDGSSDCTVEVAVASGAVVVRHAQNRGKGAALNTGFHIALQVMPQVVVMLDADGQHLPEQMGELVKPVLEGQADIVIGSRYINSTSQVPRTRIWGHRAFNLLTGLASGKRATDSQSGYRAFSPAALEKIDLRSNGFSVESEMQFIVHELGLRLIEVPITIRYMDKPKRSVWAQGMSVLNGVLWQLGQYRPLLFFGVPGFFVLLAGLGLGMYVVERYQQVHVLAIGYALSCVLLGTFGLVTMTTGITLHSIRGLLLDLLGDRNKRADKP